MGITIQDGPDRISAWGTPDEIIRVVFAVAGAIALLLLAAGIVRFLSRLGRFFLPIK
jgi:hypothetical protein